MALLLKMLYYVIEELRKFALPHEANQSVTKTNPSFTVQDGQSVKSVLQYLF
jgi:hypothetical protein